MGGKVWSEEEERVFWTEIVPSSKKRHLYSRPNHEAHGWESLRKVMQDRMGDLARRRYTSLMLYEHFFQNCVLERFSPNASRFVRAYIADDRLSTGKAPIQRSRTTQNSARRGSNYGSGNGPRPSSLRLAEARTAASAAAATQSFAEERMQERQGGRQHTSSVGQSEAKPLVKVPTSDTNPDTNLGADAEGDPDFNERSFGPSTEPTQYRTREPLPPFESLGYPSLFTSDSVQFSLPPISAIMSLPLLQPPPVPHVPPPTLSTALLRLARVPLPDNFREMQQQLAPPPETTTSYLQSLALSRERRAMSRAGYRYSPYSPRPAHSTDYGSVGAVMPMLPASSVAGSPTILPPPKNEQLSALEDIKAEEEASEEGMFVHQWHKE